MYIHIYIYLHLSYRLVGTWTVLIFKLTGKLLKFLFSTRRKSVTFTFFDSEYLICSQTNKSNFIFIVCVSCPSNPNMLITCTVLEYDIMYTVRQKTACINNALH